MWLLFIWNFICCSCVCGSKWINDNVQPDLINFRPGLHNNCNLYYDWRSSTLCHNDHHSNCQHVQSPGLYCLCFDTELGLRFRLAKDSCLNPKSKLDSCLWGFGCIHLKHSSIFYSDWRNKCRVIRLNSDSSGNNQRCTDRNGKRKWGINSTPFPSNWSQLHACGSYSDSSSPHSNPASSAGSHHAFPNCGTKSVWNLFV